MVLITGETGTGKELVAKTLHYASNRSDKPFIVLNCSAIPETIFESEIFGIEKGIATGVDKRIGKIEQAHEGAIFLDEIGDMPLTSQTKILRVIEDRILDRVGGRKPIPVDIRIVAATNKDLKKAIKNGLFREDLFYRLNVVNLVIPPLRERKNDIVLLAKFFLDQSRH
ncbi:MAG: sigma 54-interacting transcriptional regulator [Deltaproteobacteria bacterium]|nr:sigma 54-interacting transcriptional regulator [Deltaproteobacteria bacterium]